MDCIDCHNAVAHRISPTAERAVDEAIAAGRINRALPFVRREGVRLLKGEYPDQEAGLRAVDAGTADVLRLPAEARRRRASSTQAVAARPDAVGPQRVSRHEGHLGRVPGQHRPHDIVEAASGATTAARPRMARASSVTTASTATSRSKCPRLPHRQLPDRAVFRREGGASASAPLWRDAPKPTAKAEPRRRHFLRRYA